MAKTKKWKRLFGLIVAGVLAFECMLPQAIWGQVTEDGNRVVTQNLLETWDTGYGSGYNPSFEGADNSGVLYWWSGQYNNATVSQNSDCTAGNKSMRVQPLAVGKEVGADCGVGTHLETGATYEYSYDAKLDSADEGQVALVLTYLYDGVGWSKPERVLADVDEEYTFSQSNWTHVTGTFTISPAAGKTITEVHLTFSAVDSMTPFLVDDFKIGATGETSPKKEIETDLKALKDQFDEDLNYEDLDLSGKAGVAIPVSALDDEVRMELVTKHYNSVTAENEMKPDALLGGNTPTIKDGYPVLNFSNADKLMDYLLAYNEANPDQDPIRVRGHVLVWHSQTPTWFFRENYSATGNYVSPEIMLGRLENYISQVMEHFDGEGSKYQGMIYAWDVVNEAVDESTASGLRQNGDWYGVFGDNNEYVTKAFVYANEYAPSGVKLFYNDFNETVKAKADAICKLLQEIKNTKGARIDGMGMQAHYDMSSPTVGQFTYAAKAYAEVLGEGAEIQLTEVDFKSSTDYTGANQNEEYQKQAYRYKAIYDAIKSLKETEGIIFSSITFWGTDDGNSWLLTSNSVGGSADGTRIQCPLLFDANYKAKPAYYAFVDASKLEPNIQSGVAIQAASSQPAKEYSFTAGEVEVKFLPFWNKNGLQVQVEVTDATVDATDAVTIYIDSADSRSDDAEAIQTYTLTRAEATASETGYTANFTIPIADLAVMTTIGMDVSVTDGTEKGYWNDLTGNQETSSKYYGKMVMKPYMEIQKATITVDGTVDTVWSKVAEVPLTIKTGSPQVSATAKLLWDDEYLYALINVKDADLNKASADAYQQDSVEFFIDENNHKTDGYEADDMQYRINYENTASFNGTNCKAENLISSAKTTADGYYVEAAFKWTEITPEKLLQIGLELQINDASSAGSRIGTASWYDESGMGWSSPAVFGTAMLIDTLKEEVTKYSVTVSGGTGDGSYAAGTKVTIKADAAPSGKVFDKWVVESGGAKLDNVSATTTIFVMPSQAVKIKAVYKAKITYYSATVSSGTGGGNYEAGTKVTIKANAAPSGKVFDKWVVESGGVKLADASATTTTFVMPSKAVKIKAVYKNSYAKFSVKNVSIQKGKTSTALVSDLQIASGDKVKEWKSSKSTIVSVNKTSGKISAKKTGKATITVTTKQGKTASITVNVVSGKVATTKLTVQNAKTGNTIRSNSTVNLKVNEKLNLKAVVAPITSTDKVTFTTDSKKVATVSSTGKITAKKKGTATITVTSGKKTVKVKVKVK